MEFRLSGPGDKEVRWLWDYCFEKEGSPFFNWYFASYCQEGNVLAGYENGRMTACLHLNPFELSLRGTTLPVSYIVGLGVAPEARGGAAGKLLAGALAEMRRRKHWVSIIMPARADAYYPYQWELCYHQLRYAVPLADLAGLGQPWGTLRRYREEQGVAELDGVYRRFVAGRHGYTLRREEYWRQIIAEHRTNDGYIYIVENAGQAEGYIFYKMHQGRLLMRELAYTSRQAQLALIRFLYQHRSQAETAVWNAPLNDWLPFALPDPKRVVSLEPFMSARLVDVAEALAAIAYPAGTEGAVTLAVEDKLAPWNDGILALTVKNGKGMVTRPADRPAAAVSCPVGALSQLVFGRLSAYELAAMGRLQTEDEAPLAVLDRLFPKCDNYVNEYY